MNLDVDSFLEDLSKQCSHYEEMIEATREQNELIDKADMDALLEILKKKNALLQEIDGIEKRTAPIREAWAAEKNELPADVVKRVEEVVLKTKNVLQDLLKLEEVARVKMEQSKGSTAGKIKDVQQKKKMLDAYGGKKGPPESRFFDENK